MSTNRVSPVLCSIQNVSEKPAIVIESEITLLRRYSILFSTSFWVMLLARVVTHGRSDPDASAEAFCEGHEGVTERVG